MSGTFMTRRVSAAMDVPGGLDAPINAKLREELARDPAAKKWATDVQALDALLHGWPEAERSEEAWEGLAARIEQRLSEALPAGLDFTTPPFFDDEDARAGRPEPSSGRIRTEDARSEIEQKRAAFSLSKLSDLGALKLAVPPPTPPAGLAKAGAAPGGVAPVPAAPRPPERARGDERLEIPTFSQPIMPITPIGLLAPSPLTPEPPKRRTWLLLGGGGIAAAAVVVLAALAVRGLSTERSDAAASAAQLPVAAAPGETVAEAPAVSPTSPVPASALVAPPPSPSPTRAVAAPSAVAAAPAQGPSAAAEVAVRQAAPPPSAAPAVPVDAVSTGTAAHAHGAARRPPGSSTPPVAPAAPAVAGPGGAVAGGGAGSIRPRGGASSGASAAPAVAMPGRGDVMTAMASVRPSVNACAQGHGGLAQVRLTFAGPSGRVTSAVIEGQFAGTPQGSCIARAVRAATVPPFAQPTFSVLFPFQI